ncbi:MAG: glycoside hydrolase family 5 protein [Planctomycetes bacterium]|nr:glycoside hydrolase family 5 protein [Planctomycetota bacterium]
MRLRHLLFVLASIPLVVAADPAAAVSAAPANVAYTGVNLAGGEFGSYKDEAMPIYGRKYIYPQIPAVEYFIGKGMNIFRVPVKWENLQNDARQPLLQSEVERLRGVIGQITSRGAVAIIDPHNYARYRGSEIGDGVSPEDFADFWGRLAAEFKSDPRVWFGLMNEPHGLKNPQAWVDAANAATVAIRAAGAANMLLVPGNHWTSAGTWTGYGEKANSILMLGYKDPLDHFAYEVHLYLDKDNSGTHKEVVSPTVGSGRAKRFTEWCREHKVRGFLGEFAAPLVPDGQPAIEDLVTYMEANRDVWLGWTWWAAGPWWGEYMFSIEPKGGQDREQMGWLLPHLAKGAPVAFTATVTGAGGGGTLAAGGQYKLATKASFSRWEGDTAFLDDPLSPTPSLSMPNRDIALRAVGGGRPVAKAAEVAQPAVRAQPTLTDPAARTLWLDRLGRTVRDDAAAGRGPRFTWRTMRATATIDALAEDGTMQLSIAGSGAMSAPWSGLGDRELADVACDLARGDQPERQAGAAFFLLLVGEVEAARLRLTQAGTHAAAVERAFSR